jgi:hypothetical protein
VRSMSRTIVIAHCVTCEWAFSSLYRAAHSNWLCC